jgi:type IV pilus assembly protein PilQ
MDVIDANATDIIREIGYQSKVNMITYGLPKNKITAKINNLTIDQVLTYIFRGTSYTFRKEGDIYIIGDKSTSGIASSKLIRLKHLRSDVLVDLLPNSVINNATVEVIKEQNGLMVIGTNDVIVELENFIQQIDFPTPQIMIEALVVDVNTTDMYQLGASLSSGMAPDSSFFNPFTVLFGSNNQMSDGLTIQGNGLDLNATFSPGGNLFGIRNLGKLPKDFFFRIQALDQEGLVTIQSRPQISTLNGHTASIEIGTTQYYIFTSTTPIQSPNQVITQESQRFETIEANVKLEITPWVSASGDVTVDIKPEFKTPVGNFSADVPPTINSRILDSTVRLKDGETIILGGLIQETNVDNINKVPILGSIPLLGRLFRNKRTSTVKSELVVFVTPYVFYGDGDDAYRWRQIRDDMELSIDN